MGGKVHEETFPEPQTHMDNPKLFGALLNGVQKRVFESDQSITPELLQEQVFGEEASPEEISKMCEISAKVMAQAAYKNWELSKLETVLSNVSFERSLNDFIVLKHSL